MLKYKVVRVYDRKRPYNISLLKQELFWPPVGQRALTSVLMSVCDSFLLLTSVPIVTKLIKITDSWGHACPKGKMIAKMARMPWLLLEYQPQQPISIEVSSKHQYVVGSGWVKCSSCHTLKCSKKCVKKERKSFVKLSVKSSKEAWTNCWWKIINLRFILRWEEIIKSYWPSFE